MKCLRLLLGIALVVPMSLIVLAITMSGGFTLALVSMVIPIGPNDAALDIERTITAVTNPVMSLLS